MTGGIFGRSELDIAISEGIAGVRRVGYAVDCWTYYIARHGTLAHRSQVWREGPIMTSRLSECGLAAI